MRFRLSEEDAERLNCPREVEFDESKLTGREVIAMKKLTGWSFERLGVARAGERVTDDQGNQVWDIDDAGVPVRDEAGNRVPLVAVDPEVILVMVWVAVRRAVGDRPWADFDINFADLTFLGDDEGKAESPTTASTSASTATKRTTSGTSRSSRKSSASPRGSRGTR